MIAMFTVIAESLFQYGIAGAVIASVFVLVITPLLRHLLAINRQSVELLRKSVEANTVAVRAFQRFEAEEHEVHSLLIETQERIINRIDTIERHVRPNGNGVQIEP
jgi:hypothetical protein